MTSTGQDEQHMAEIRRVNTMRDTWVRDARANGMTKYRIVQLTGLGRMTVDRILGEGKANAARHVA